MRQVCRKDCGRVGYQREILVLDSLTSFESRKAQQVFVSHPALLSNPLPKKYILKLVKSNVYTQHIKSCKYSSNEIYIQQTKSGHTTSKIGRHFNITIILHRERNFKTNTLGWQRTTVEDKVSYDIAYSIRLKASGIFVQNKGDKTGH